METLIRLSPHSGEFLFIQSNHLAACAPIPGAEPVVSCHKTTTCPPLSSDDKTAPRIIPITHSLDYSEKTHLS